MVVLVNGLGGSSDVVGLNLLVLGLLLLVVDDGGEIWQDSVGRVDRIRMQCWHSRM